MPKLLSRLGIPLGIAACALLAAAANTVQDPALQEPPPPQNPSTPEPRAADVATPGAVVDALYATISGPAGEKRDGDRLRSLFHPEGRMAPMVRHPEQGMRPTLITVDDYISRSGKMLEENGFHEQEIARRSETFGDIAQVFSSYAARRKLTDAEPWFRGINSIQLCRLGDSGWRVLSILWEQEHDAGPIPARYLPGKGD